MKIKYPVIVEGKYDKIKITSLFEAKVITTDGFGIFNKKEKLALIRALAANSKIIVLTDSDGAGKLIRSHITGALPKEKIIQLYIPRVEGKERRKVEASAEGTLGVEGMERELLYELLKPFEGDVQRESRITKTDLYADGLSGGENSAQKRAALCRELGLPEDMTANALLEALKILISYEEYCRIVGRNSK